MSEKKLSILVADDDEGDRKQIKRVIKQTSLDCDIEEAEDMYQALEICSEKQFDFAFLDYQMPGNEDLKGVSSLHNTCPSTSIVLMTGQGDEEVASAAFKLGAVDYIPKRLVSADSIRLIIERALEHAALQKKVNEQRDSLEKFSHILGHDLTAPARSMGLLSELMSKAIEEKNYEKLGEYCDIVRTASQHMCELISALSNYNKLDVPEVVFETIAMQQLVDVAMDSLRSIIEDKNASIMYDELPNIYGNAPQLTQLMQNLIGNALKYCDRPTPEVHISAAKVDKGIRICVSDNGIGIDKQFYHSIFEPFKRLHGAGDEQYSGAGLGLATCIKIIQRHGGEIWCESEKDKGSKFFFTLPGEADFKEN